MKPLAQKPDPPAPFECQSKVLGRIRYKNKMKMKIQVKLSNMKKAKWIIFPRVHLFRFDFRLKIIANSNKIYITTQPVK